MADKNGKPAENEEDWEYEDEEADDYEWEYETEEEEGGEKSEKGGRKVKGQVENEENDEKVEESEENDDEDSEEEIPEELPDPFSSNGQKKVAAPVINNSNKPTIPDVKNGHQPTNGKEEEGEASAGEENGKKKHHKKKKSRHQERIDELQAYNKDKEKSGDSRSKKIHVRSKDPFRIARQFEKADKVDKKSSKHSGNGGRKVVAPPPQKINQICKICNKEPYLTERIIAEKSWWCKKCFKCSVCNKILNLDTYMSHEGILFCKPHHKELFMPKTVKSDIIDVENVTKQQEAVLRHQEQQRKHETIIRENNPEKSREDVVKSSTCTKWSGMEDLDVGSKFKKFEAASNEDDLGSERVPSSDRYGIMEKLKRLQDGADLDDLLAEMDEELPSDEEEEEDEEDLYLTEVQKKTKRTEKLFSEDVKKAKKDETVRREMQALRKRLNCGGTSNKIDDFDDLLNASSHKVQKTKVDVRSENAKKFRDMFDKGEVPEDDKKSDRITADKEAELDQMRKSKRAQADYFKMMEAGKLHEQEKPTRRREPKLLVGKLKDKPEANGDAVDEDLPELASLSNRFSYFENFDDKQEVRKKKSDAAPGEEGGEREMARRECKAKGVLNKFKEMENRVLNGEPEVPPAAHDPDKPIFTALGFLGKLPGVEDKRRPLKRFTPPRKGTGSDSETETGSDYSDSEYSGSYTDSYSESESDEEDETLKAIRNAQRAKELRGKFEAWEDSEDAKEQLAQMERYDENGEKLETASILRKKFEALRMHEENQNKTPAPIPKGQYRPKRFK